MTDIEKNSRPLLQIPLEVKYDTNHFKMDLQDSIDLLDGSYVIVVSYFNTYNSIFNFTYRNNKIIYFDGLVFWKDILSPPCAYEIEQIYNEVARQFSLDESPIILEANTATLHSNIRLTNGYKVDSTQPNS